MIYIRYSIEAFYDLQLQLSSEMSRSYLVLVHGWLKPWIFKARLHWWGNGPTLCGRGRLAKLKNLN